MKGNPRFDAPWIPNTGGGANPYYDMGALEYVKPSAPDSDGDGKTDIAVENIPISFINCSVTSERTPGISPRRLP